MNNDYHSEWREFKEFEDEVSIDIRRERCAHTWKDLAYTLEEWTEELHEFEHGEVTLFIGDYYVFIEHKNEEFFIEVNHRVIDTEECIYNGKSITKAIAKHITTLECQK